MTEMAARREVALRFRHVTYGEQGLESHTFGIVLPENKWSMLRQMLHEFHRPGQERHARGVEEPVREHRRPY